MKNRRFIRAVVSQTATIALPPLGTLVTAFGAGLSLLYRGSWPTRRITYYDHRFSHLAGPHQWRWLERAFVGAGVLSPESRVLDLCCGDGFFTSVCFAPLCKTIDGVDRDPTAIRVAAKQKGGTDVRWFVSDLAREALPGTAYDVVFLFASLQYFSETEADQLCGRIACALHLGGIFVGSVPAPSSSLGKGEFTKWDEPRVATLLNRHFSDVTVWVGLTGQLYFRGIRAVDDSIREPEPGQVIEVVSTHTITRD